MRLAWRQILYSCCVGVDIHSTLQGADLWCTFATNWKASFTNQAAFEDFSKNAE